MIATRESGRIPHSSPSRLWPFPTDAEALRVEHRQIRRVPICFLLCRGYRNPYSVFLFLFKILLIATAATSLVSLKHIPSKVSSPAAPIERIVRCKPHSERGLWSKISTSVQRFRGDATCTRPRFPTRAWSLDFPVHFCFS